MSFKFIQLMMIVFLSAAVVIGINAQGILPDVSGSSDKSKEEMPKNIKESLAKNRIDREKKDYEELVGRGEEIVTLSAEIGKSFERQKTFSAEDRKKIDRLEKLVKRIRKELGGDDDAVSDKIVPTNLTTAIKILQEKTEFLLEELKKCTPYSISVVAIENSNTLSKIVDFIQTGKN